MMLTGTAPLPQIPVDQVLQIFHESQIYLCLGAVITCVGLLAVAVCVLRRKADPLLLWFALFAVLYGVRLVIRHEPSVRLGLQSHTVLWITVGLGYLVPVPAFFFFKELNLLHRVGRTLLYVVTPVLVVLSLVSLIAGPNYILWNINSLVVTISLAVSALELALDRTASRDTRPINRGLILFILCAIYENLTDYIHIPYYNIEPFAFLILLCALGMVAGRRTLAREQQLKLIENELEIAQRIQLAILPHEFPPSHSFQVRTRYQPMTAVAGDFYEYLPLSDWETGLLIADVSGHGVPAALIASMVKVVAASVRPFADDPAAVLRRMNSELCGNVQTHFVTAAYAYLNARTGELRYGAAAHPPMLLQRGDAVMSIEENGLLLGAFDFAEYTTRTLQLQAGDRVVLYTDGLLEAADKSGTEFGEDRLTALLQESRTLSAADCANRMVDAVQQWSAAQTDDLTVMVCDFTGGAA